MKKGILKIVSALLAVFLLSGCSGKKPQPAPQSTRDTLVVGTQNFDGKFSPFFYTNGYEGDVMDLVHLTLFTTDREGAVVLRGIEGETRPYNGTDYTYTGIADCAITENTDGTVYYDITLKEGVRFSDSSVVDIDDVIFSLYVPLDPDYDGTMTLYSLPIAGLKDYREGSAPNISGIQKTGANTLRIVLTEVSATAIYDLAIPVAPMHYYGSEALYDYENNLFGFPKGDLSTVRSVTTKPMGGGPYRFISYAGGVVTLQANPLYWKGAPKIKYIQFQEGQDADKVSGMIAGTLDITEPAYSPETAKAIKNANAGSEILQTRMVSNLGYGYVGINAKNVCIGNDPGSDASKNLRKALATMISVYRDVAVDSYFGQYANVIHYPISDTSWASPRPTDEGYREAFSVDVDQKPIYSKGMSAQERYDAAKKATLGFLEAAGYGVSDGKITAPPKGGVMEYEVLISGGGTGDHPTFMALSMASQALQELGFRLIVTDISNFSQLSNAVHSGSTELFAMAWSATADPDMYQIYHSQGSSNEKSYFLKDPALDELILLARQSTDRSYRKLLYRECLEIIGDWAVEIPMYQRQNVILFSAQRVNLDTLTPDITTFWDWQNDIEKLEMR